VTDDHRHPLERLAVEMERANPAVAERLRRRRIRVGRGAMLRLHILVPVVLADTREHGPDDGFHFMAAGTAHVTIWVTGDPADVVPTVDSLIARYTPAGAFVTYEVRRAGLWQRAVGAWRLLTSASRRFST